MKKQKQQKAPPVGRAGQAPNKTKPKNATAQDFTNIVDIRGQFLYTRDGYIITFIKIEPVSIDLLSENERISLVKSITAGLSAERKPYKIMAISRPVDISPVIAKYQEDMLNCDNSIRKKLLRNEMVVLSDYIMSGEVVERQFFLSIWEKDGEDGAEKELVKRMSDIVSTFNAVKIRTSGLSEKDTIRLCNLVNNPAYSHIEDADYDAGIATVLAGLHQ